MTKPAELFAPIDAADLETVSGGDGLLSGVGSAISSGFGAVNNFKNGFAGGAIYGANAKVDQIEQFGNKQQTGFGPGVETGMMFNQALGPVGKLMSTAAKGVPTGDGGGGGE